VTARPVHAPAAAEALRRHLVESRLAGSVATAPVSTLENCSRLVTGNEHHTFGLSDWMDASLLDAVEAVRALCGGDPGGADPLGDGWIDPAGTMAAIRLHRDRLARTATAGGRVLLATGHPTGLLGHYTAIARALQVRGCLILAPLDDTFVEQGSDGRRRGIRFVDGVACAFDGASLRHTHRSIYMEAMLDELGGPDAVDVVVADHGMAGTAIEQGIPTLSIADVNDPALALSQARGRTDAVLPVDDNLPPRQFIPVTRAMLDW
jgi:hypothetical protein